MNKCSVCDMIAKYAVQPVVTDVAGATTYYCEGHMVNAIATGADAYRITKETHTQDKLLTAKTGPYIGAIGDTRATL